MSDNNDITEDNRRSKKVIKIILLSVIFLIVAILLCSIAFYLVFSIHSVKQ
jgi:flagellar basal body-associated protein FliL